MDLITGIGIVSSVIIIIFILDKFDEAGKNLTDYSDSFRDELEERLIHAGIIIFIGFIFSFISVFYPLPFNPIDTMVGALLAGVTWPLALIIDEVLTGD